MADVDPAAPTGRRRGAESSAVRARLIDAAVALIRDEGYGAVTTSRLAQAVGLKRHIVHYYFGTIEEVFLAVLRRESEKMHAQVTAALQSDEPLRVIWEPANHFPPLTLEFFAMAMRHTSLQQDVRRYAHEFRAMQAEAVRRYIAAKGIVTTIPAEAIAYVIMSVSRLISADGTSGITAGHAEARALLESWIDQFAAGTGAFTGA